MNIILINSKYEYYEAIESSLNVEGIRLSIIDAPPLIDEAFLSRLMELRETFEPDYILSLDYIPYLSNACKVLNLGYIAWITGGYNPNNYDYTIRNEWNKLFVTDPILCNYYERIGCPCVSFLPLAPNLSRNASDLGIAHFCENNLRPILWTEGLTKESSINVKMPLLKDSTKGYIDGFVESHKNDLNHRSMFERMHDYVRNDITENYPLERDGLETIPELYDNRFFFPHIDESIAEKYIRNNIICKDIPKYYIVTEHEVSYEDWRIKWIRHDDENLTTYIKVAPYNILLPGLLNGARITQDMWNVMALGGHLFIPRQIDVGILGDLCPDKFGNQRDLDILIGKTNHAREFGFENNIDKRTKDIQEEVLLNHTYLLRVKKLLSEL